MSETIAPVKMNTAGNTRKPAAAMIRIEKRPARRFVTVISGLHTFGSEKLKKIAGEIKTAHGGVVEVRGGAIEIQGDKLAEAKAWFASQTV